MLPILPRSGASPEQAAAAAQSVHQIRSLIQLGAADHKVIAVTSATAGDGKTSLTLSLGMSFAASGARTLLVDFDMIGRGLSRQLKVDAAPHGLADALQSGVLNGCILPSSVPGLSVVPLRSGDERFINRLSDGLVQRFLDSVRPDFDVVLFDTGPILGSLEANFVVAAADGVLVIVGRGQQRPLVQRALAHLGSVGSCVIGLVFNRASAVDFRRSASSASFRTVSAVPADALTLAPLPPEAANLDPISRTVAADIRT
jgi:Mrp family chromosome partitioning ATPase